MPVVSATQEAEVEELLEPERQLSIHLLKDFVHTLKTHIVTKLLKYVS